MFCGQTIQLRLMRDTDLETVFTCMSDIRNRGDYFPINIHAEGWWRRHFEDDGFWSQDSGMLLMTNLAQAIIGHIEFFRPVAYLDAYELSYLIYDAGERRKGATTEAVSLLTKYLFETKKVNRLQLIIHPDNAASQRVAQKNGFVDEGVMRGAWYHRGQYHDVKVYALLRHEYAAL
jgi:ribosomal-protein-alanine N-acetyltransferase